MKELYFTLGYSYPNQGRDDNYYTTIHYIGERVQKKNSNHILSAEFQQLKKNRFLLKKCDRK